MQSGSALEGRGVSVALPSAIKANSIQASELRNRSLIPHKLYSHLEGWQLIFAGSITIDPMPWNANLPFLKETLNLPKII